MAGYTKNVNHPLDKLFEFHIDTEKVAARIRQANNQARVIAMQLDGDELDAALWGLENYPKGGGNIQTRSETIGLRFWPTIAEAMAQAKNDSSIWKVSWTDVSTGERVRIVRRSYQTGGDEWLYEPIVLPEVPSA